MTVSCGMLVFPNHYCIELAMNPVPNTRRVVAFALICILAWPGGGCANKRPPAFTGSSATLSGAAKSVEQDGARVTVEVFRDRERCGRFFHLSDAYADGLAIVYVKVENLDPSRSLLAQHSGIHLLLGENAAGAGRTTQSTAGGEAAALAGAAVISLPLMFIGGALISNAAIVQENFVTKEFRNDTLSPGASAAGFAYFQLDKKTLLRNGGTVKVVLRRPLNQGDITVEVPLPKS